MNHKSRSALTFNELKNKTEDIYEFGNDWGLYIDIEKNYHQHFKEMREKKINRIINTLDKISEIENEYDDVYDELNKDNHETYTDKDKDKYKDKNNFNNSKINGYINYFRTCLRELIIYLFIIFGISYIFDNKNSKKIKNQL